MVDVLKNYMDSKEAEIAEKERELAEIDKIIAEQNISYTTYLIKDNRSNEEIKRIFKDLTDDFINKIRESIIHS